MCSRQQRRSQFYYGGYSTSSPVFYSIPWKPSEYSLTGLGPGSSAILKDPLLTCEGLNNNHAKDRTGQLDYSKAGFTYYNNNKCLCGFLTEYRKQYNRRGATSARTYEKPWWNGREMTSKFDPKYPCHSRDAESVSTYAKDFTGARGDAADLCYPEGEIERAGRVVLRRRDMPCQEHPALERKPLFASAFNLNCY